MTNKINKLCLSQKKKKTLHLCTFLFNKCTVGSKIILALEIIRAKSLVPNAVL